MKYSIRNLIKVTVFFAIVFLQMQLVGTAIVIATWGLIPLTFVAVAALNRGR